MKRWMHSSTSLSAQGIMNYLEWPGYVKSIYIDGYENDPWYAAQMLANSSVTDAQLDDLKNGVTIEIDGHHFYVEYAE